MSTPFSHEEYRKAMGGFASGICVLGARRTDGLQIGMTVNSFSSVSLDPPLVLVCLGNETPRSRSIIEAGQFSISILAEDQRLMSDHFACSGDGQIPEHGCDEASNGAPVVAGAVTILECDLETTHLAGDHQIVIGRVTKLSLEDGRAPLLYCQGRYRALGEDM